MLWIAGEGAAWITGEVLRVDGGSSTGAGHLPRLWPPAPTDAPESTPENDPQNTPDTQGAST